MAIKQVPIKDCNCVESCKLGYDLGICPRALLKRGFKTTEKFYMTKEESVKAAMGKFEEAIGLVYDEGMEAGKLEAPAPAPVEQAPVQDPVVVDPSQQADLDAALEPFKTRIAELEAKLAEPDATPFDQSAVDAAVEKATADLKAELEAASDEHDEKEEAIADAMAALVEQVRGLTSKKAAAPAEGEVQA